MQTSPFNIYKFRIFQIREIVKERYTQPLLLEANFNLLQNTDIVRSKFKLNTEKRSRLSSIFHVLPPFFSEICMFKLCLDFQADIYLNLGHFKLIKI